MIELEASMRGNFLLGVLIGAVAVRFGPELRRDGRPLVKAGLKAGVEGYLAARRAMIRLAEDVEDLVAEVGAELAEKAASPADDDVIRAGSESRAG